MFCSSIVSFEDRILFSILNFVEDGIVTFSSEDKMILRSLVVKFRGTMIGLISLNGVEKFN